MAQMTIAEALAPGVREEMPRDERVFCIGEDIGVRGGWGGAFTVTLGLEKDFRERIIDTPISEGGFFGLALGAAMMGLRPVADVQYGDFLLYAMDQVVNQIAKMRYMSGGKVRVPLVMRAPVGATGRGAQHGQNLEAIFFSVPGLKIACPATAYDAKGLLKAAIRDDNPVLLFEHKLLYGSKGARAESGAVDASSEIPDEDYVVPLGKGMVRREGTDVTIIATLLMMHRALEAASTPGAGGHQRRGDRSAQPGAFRLGPGERLRDEDHAGGDRRGRPSPGRLGRGNRRHPRRDTERLPDRAGQAGGLAEHPGSLFPSHGELLPAGRGAHSESGAGSGGRVGGASSEAEQVQRTPEVTPHPNLKIQPSPLGRGWIAPAFFPAGARRVRGWLRGWRRILEVTPHPSCCGW